MNKLVLFAVAAVAILGATSYLMMKKPTLTAYPHEVVVAFNAFCNKYAKYQAGTDADKIAYRLGVFYKNWQKIKYHSKHSSYTLAENQLMDLTHEEFVNFYLGYKGTATQKNVKYLTPKATEAVDWRTKGAVTAIKNQGQCGSCWAFSTTGSVEGAYFLSGQKLTSFSEQQLVDCSSSYGNQGCNGGLMDDAFQYIKAEGITTESSYPYTATTDSCQAFTSVAKITGYTDVQAKSPAQLLAAITKQPVSVAVDATNWQFYSKGIFHNCGTQLDHGVLAVGNDDDGNYIVKNSWGTSWGEQGYIQLKEGNTCGITSDASYPSF